MSLEDKIKNLSITESHSCGCGCKPEIPEFDVAPVPHRIRHGAIHGALSVLEPGEALILRAPHDPKPLIEEIKARPEPFTITYLENTPTMCRVKIERG